MVMEPEMSSPKQTMRGSSPLAASDCPKAQARGLHLDLHGFGGVPPVVAVELGHLGVEFALDLGLIFLGVSEQLLDREPGLRTRVPSSLAFNSSAFGVLPCHPATVLP
jgi:hypothetical protein